MTFGEKIKELRTKANLTQLDLADKLNVTYQAVSRWENDNVEPSISTIKDMALIFGCSTDELLGLVAENKTEEPQVVQTVQPVKQVLTICEECNKPLYAQEDIHRWSYNHTTRHGRSHHTETKSIVLCEDCYNEHVKKEEEENERLRLAIKADFKKQTVHSFIWPSVALVIMLVFAIVCFADPGYADAGWFYVYCGVSLFTFIGCLILNNNFIGEMWLEISSWGFVKLPGVIFEFSIDGFIIGLLIKVLLGILGFLLAAAAVVFATILGAFLSIFVYPFSIAEHFKGRI